MTSSDFKPLKHPEGDKFIRSGTFRRLWIVTGGQTGVDRAALDVALQLRLPVRGWCPKDRIAEDGKIAAVYPLQETSSADPALRTELNVLDSDATLILSDGPLSGGTLLTADLAKHHARPLLCLDLKEEKTENLLDGFWTWLDNSRIRVLNIAGPRESHHPGYMYDQSIKILRFLLARG